MIESIRQKLFEEYDEALQTYAHYHRGLGVGLVELTDEQAKDLTDLRMALTDKLLNLIQYEKNQNGKHLEAAALILAAKMTSSPYPATDKDCDAAVAFVEELELAFIRRSNIAREVL